GGAARLLGPRRPGRRLRSVAGRGGRCRGAPPAPARRPRRGSLRRPLPPGPRVAEVPLHRPRAALRAAAPGLARRPGGRLLHRRGRAAAGGRGAFRRRCPGPGDAVAGRLTAMETSSPVLLEVRDGVATITLNRPEAMNSLDVATKERLREVVTTVAADPEA